MTKVACDKSGLLAALQQMASLDVPEAELPSAESRAILLSFATGAPAPTCPASGVDWDRVFREVCRHGLLGLAHRSVALCRANDRPNSPPPAFQDMITWAHGLSTLRLTTLYCAVGATLAGLSDGGLAPVVLKGPALAQLVYPEPLLRTFSDLDLLVRDREVIPLHRALLAQGFEATRDPALLPPRLVPQLTVHELQYWHPERHLLVEVHVDDPFSVGLVARDIEGYLRRAVPVSIAGVPVKALALDDQILQLCTHAHYHAYARLNWLSDLAFIIRDYGDALDWGRIVAAARAEALQVPVYYSLRLLGLLLNIHVPTETLAALRPDHFRRWWHERYLPEAELRAHGTSQRPFTGFYYFPLFTRFLPDLLVMGRRREKLRCMLRLLVPQSAWLRAYYQLADAQSVAPHYLLHPLKLVSHYLGEIPPLLTSRWRERRAG